MSNPEPGQSAAERAVAFLIEAHRGARRPALLPPELAPDTVEAALAIQQALAAALDDPVAGWKVSLSGEPMRAPILRSRMHASPAELPSDGLAPFGIEAEIAFRFERPLPPRAQPYEWRDLVGSAVALPVIEVVSSRFADYAAAPALDRLCDLMSNGALVVGSPLADWAGIDFTRLRVRLERDDAVIVDRAGGHPQQDPCGWGLALVNQLRLGAGVPQGLVVTTGSFTGLVYGAPGETYRTQFEGFAPVGLRFA